MPNRKAGSKQSWQYSNAGRLLVRMASDPARRRALSLQQLSTTLLVRRREAPTEYTQLWEDREN